MQIYILLLGTAMIAGGIVLLAYGRSGEGRNTLKLLGFEFNLSHPSLVVVVLGFCLIIKEISGTDADTPQGKLGPEPLGHTSVTQTEAAKPVTANPCDDPVKKSTLFACLPEK